MIFEDAHWADPTSRELLDLTVERVRRLPVLLVVTFRPEFQPPWTGQPQVTMLTLNRLDRRDRSALIEHVAAGKALPAEVVAQIAERTDGVPLFVEELTKSVLESGVTPLGIPATLHDSLMARLDRLGSVRRVAQIGAAFGREFSYAPLCAVCGLSEGELQAALARLVASELVFQRGAAPDAVYAFKHALVQDAAHSSLLRSARQQLHAQIAEALAVQSPELMDNQPELFAQHYAEAGLVEKSVVYWAKAGHRSAARSAMAEAAAQFQKGLDQLALLPDGPERQRQELELRSSQGAVLFVLKGHAAPETGQAYSRARELWEQLGSPSEFLRVPYGQARYHVVRGEFDLALRLDEDLLRLSQQRSDSAGLVLGHYSSARNLMFAGRFASSRTHLEEVLALYDPSSHRPLIYQAGDDPHANAQGILGIVIFCLGFPDRALAQSKAAIDEARRLAHPPSLASVLALGNMLVSLVGDDTALNQRAEQLVEIAVEQSFPWWGAQGGIYLGWAKVKNGELLEGISRLRHCLSAHRATGAELWMPHHITRLATACELTGQIDEALALSDEALQLVERTGEHWFEAELHRHKGQLLLRQAHFETAEELYRKALSIAEEQAAKLWELRAAVSLARLCRDQGRRAEARDLLTPVYGWFTEGFDTADLKEAKALLVELA
jgi:predicted ATPase